MFYDLLIVLVLVLFAAILSCVLNPAFWQMIRNASYWDKKQDNERRKSKEVKHDLSNLSKRN